MLHQQISKARGSRGFTMLEMIISVTLTLSLAYLVSTFAISGRRTGIVAERQVAVLEANIDLMAKMRSTLENAVFLPQNNAAGLAYLQLLDLTGLPPSIKSTLPTLDLTGIFEKEATSATKTGNLLAYALQERTDEFQCSSGRVYRVEIYRFHAYYLTKYGASTADNALNLSRFVSEPLVDGWTIDTITDTTDKTEVLLHLRAGSPDRYGQQHEPLEVAWIVGGDLADPDTLRQIEAAGTLKQTSYGPKRTGVWRILRARKLCSANLLGYRRLGVPTNAVGARMDLGRFGVINNSADGFPHGFEIQIIDTLDARQVLVRLVILDTATGGRAFSDRQIVAYVPNGLTS